MRITKVTLHQAWMVLHLEGHKYPLAALEYWKYPKLRNASAAQRADYRLIGGGTGIHWPQLDEDLSLAEIVQSDKRDVT